MKKKIIFIIICILALLITQEGSHVHIENGKENPSLYQPLNRYFQFFQNCFLYAETSNQTQKDKTRKEAYNNYIELKKLYTKWNKGLLKSRSYYKRFITKYLISIIGKEIVTDYDYLVISPEGADEKELTCNLYLGRWLQIKGDIKQETLVKIVEKNPALLTKWWRSQKLLSVQGRVKDFKLDSDQFGEVVILHLKDIKVKEVAGDIAGKNSK